MAKTQVTIAGATTTTTDPLPVASTIDGVNDYLAIYTASATATQAINRQTLLGVTGQPVDISSVQTLTSKTLTAPAISAPVLSGTVSGTYTIGGTPTFPASVVTLTGSQTLTNKVLTSPTINGGTLDNATVTVDSVAGHTSANVGTLYGVSFNAGTLTGLANGTISGTNLATTAITLGYAQITANFTTASATAVQVTGLTATVTVPAGGRKVKVTAWTPQLIAVGGTANVTMTLWDGVVGAGTQISTAQFAGATATLGSQQTAVAVVIPAAGSKTYNVGLATSANTGSVNATASGPAFLLVEAI